MSNEKTPDNVIHVAFGPDGGKRVAPPPESLLPLAPPSLAPGAELPQNTERKDPVSDVYGVADVSRLFGLSISRLRYWERTGFLVPSAKVGRRRCYTFQDLIGIRTARGLLQQGLPLRSVRKSVDALRESLPKVVRPLSELRIVADGQSVVVRGDRAAFEPTTGQLVLDFEVRELRDDIVRMLGAEAGAPRDRRAAYEAYLEGCRLDEDETTLERAEAAYRRSIELDPTLANALTNLGNLRYRRGLIEEAESMYRKALAIDGDQPEAFYNIGFLLYERGELDAAVASFRQSIEADPSFADAHFNLAMVLEDMGNPGAARPHWDTYLELEPEGAWAEVARRHLRGGAQVPT